MKLSATLLTLACLCALPAMAEITPTPAGAKITLDSVTTEVMVCSPTQVRVIKYIGAYDGPAATGAKPDLKRIADHGKYKIDTGEYYVAINEKDGNVSFWDHNGTLIMAEQHRTSSLAPVTGTDSYSVRQDFQFGRADVQTIATPGVDKNLIGTLAELGSALPTPCVVTDKGFAVIWQSGLPGRMDDTPGRKVKKPGDVTFTSDTTQAIDYLFLFPASTSSLTSFDW
ncbi:MAG: DUF4968 domain-containing protein [Duncaniella sp.]|nr:DUF4968 domain-containing protein [Duncaniella sp.]